MKVLMVNTFHHERGGDSTYALTLSAHLRGRGHEVVPLAMRHPDNLPSPWEQHFVSWVDMRATSRWQKLRAARRMIWSAEAARACATLIERVRPDVAHLQHLHRHLTPSVLEPIRRAGVPVVWTVHDHELVCPEGHLFRNGRPCEDCRGHRYWEAVRHRCKWGEPLPSLAAAVEKGVHHLRGVLRHVDRFLCPSRFLADVLVRFGVPQARVHHHPNFLDLSDHPPSDEVGAGWLVAGRLSQEKGVQVAIEAARQLPGHDLWICGTGPAEAQLRRRAADLPHVHFAGHVSRSQLAERLRSVRAVAVPSTWYENFPYAVLEAQAAQRAVVASSIGGIPEQIEHGVDGLLVPPGDTSALVRALAPLLQGDGQSALALGRAGRERVATRLAPADHLDRTLAHYRAAGSPRSGG